MISIPYRLTWDYFTTGCERRSVERKFHENKYEQWLKAKTKIATIRSGKKYKFWKFWSVFDLTNKMGKSENIEDLPTIITKTRAPKKSNFSINAILTNLTTTPPELSPSPSNNSEQDYSDDDVNVDIESDIEGNYRLLVSLSLKISQAKIYFTVISPLISITTWSEFTPISVCYVRHTTFSNVKKSFLHVFNRFANE